MKVYTDNDGFTKVIWQDETEAIAAALKGLSYEETLDLWEELENEFASKGLMADFVRNMCLVDRFFLQVMILGRQDMLKPWLFERTREVEKDPDGFLDLWARFHYKSSIITYAGIIQEVLRNPETTIGIFSFTKNAARKFLRQIKQAFEDKQILKDVFPDILYANPAKESPKWTIDSGITVRRRSNPKEATVEGWGVIDGQPTGAHFLLRVYDDLVTAESVTTPEQVEKTTEMLALSQNLGMEGGRVWYIGTRYSFGDTYQNMIEKNQVKVRIYPATDDGTRDGKPVLLSPEYWEEIKRNQTTTSLACQMLQNPLSGSQAMFDVSMIGTYEIRPKTLNIYILCDPASSLKQGSDKTAMVVIGVDSRMNKFLLDGYHHRMGLAEKWTKLKGLHSYWSQQIGVQGCYVGYEKYGAQSDIEHFKLEMERSGSYFEIRELAWPKSSQGAKIDRMGRLEPDFRNSRIFLPCVIRKGGHLFYWSFEKKGQDTITIRDFKGPTKMMQSFPDFSCRPISRVNEDGHTYDLCNDFIMQAKTVPYAGGKDDLVDAVSRIYDMEPRPPMIINGGSLYPDIVDE
jgi:hypothetical protein